MAKEWFQRHGSNAMLVERCEDGKYRWQAWLGSGHPSYQTGLCDDEANAKRNAEAAAGLGPKVPADPAWMVKVAREANARRCEAQGFSSVAAEFRRGDNDVWPEMARAEDLLRLALERGHVVETQGGPLLPLIAMKGPMHRAWRAGFRNARSEARALLDSVQLDDKAEANCTRHVNDILSTLPTREA